MNSADIERQVGAARGLWTHTPTDWAGNEGTTKAGSWPTDAAQGYVGGATGSRPGQWFNMVVPAGGVTIDGIRIVSIGTTIAGVQFTLGSLPTAAASVQYGTTPALGSSTAAGSATAGQQTVNLSGLTTKTLYYFTVTATNAQGTTVTSQGVFTTL